ncbi:hypothetical protein ACEN2T_18215 [Pseudomonas sp. W22_MBD1_FP4]|uniref:hypothetical protein n=1 Tax=Pseudomonas sp. W22_MBD1_FP4 TaxID=3240272 RepID=UPI003F9AAAF6
MNQKTNVLDLDLKPRTSVKAVATTRSASAQAALNKIASTFMDIVTKPNIGKRDEGDTEKHQGISYGAYNAISYRAADGTVMHSCGTAITEMRAQRQLTHNAIEMRCDALGLVIYVGGVSQVNPAERTIMQAIRLACYQHKSTKPEIITVADSLALYRECHNVLLTTFNRLARAYNLAGLTKDDLTLVSDSDRMPNILLTEPV